MAIPTYLKNLGKSLGYSVRDNAKLYNPVLTGMITETKDTAQELYSSIKTFGGELKLSDEKPLMQELKESAKDALSNLWDDIRTGKLYNPDRGDALDNMALAAMGFDLSDMDLDFDLDDWGSDDFTPEDATKAQMSQDVKNTRATITAMDKVGGKVAKSVATSNARTASYLASVTSKGNRALYALNQRGFNNVSKALLNMNNNMVEFAKITEPMTTHFNNASVFYTQATEKLNKIEEHLANMEKAMTSTTALTASNPKNGISSILDVDTGISISNYKDLIKENFKDDKWLMDALTDGIKNIKSSKKNGSLGASLPLGIWISNYIVKGMIPKVIKESMIEMNESIKDFMGAGVLNLRDRFNKNLVGSIIADYLFPKDTFKKTYDTSKYKKDAIPWDGISKKALTEVIPEYLSKIYQSISGTDMVYNYDKGKFVSRSSIKNDIETDKRRRANSAGGDFMRDAARRYAAVNNVSMSEAENIVGEFFYKAAFGNDDERKVAAHIGTANAADLATLGLDPKIIESLREVMSAYKDIAAMPASKKNENMRNAQSAFNRYRVDIESARASYGNMIREDEVNGTSLLRLLYNGTDSGKKGGILSNVSVFQNAVTQSINNIEKYVMQASLYLKFIEKNLSGGNSFLNFDQRGYARRQVRPRVENQNVRGDNRTVNPNSGSNNRENRTQSSSGNRTTSSTQDDAAAAPRQFTKSATEQLLNAYADPDFNNTEVEITGDETETKQVTGIKKLWGKVEDWLRKNKNRLVTVDPKNAGGVIGGIANILNAVSYSVNTMFMGTDENDKKHGLINVLSDEISKAFSSLRDIYDKYAKEHVDKFKGYLKNAFGDIFTKTGLKDYWTGVKGKLKSWGRGFGNSAVNVLFGKDNRKRYYNKLIKEGYEPSFAYQQAYGDLSTDEYAYGTNYVPRTGLAILSEGEMVIPSELNPFYNRPTNKRQEIRKEKEVYRKYFGNYASGTASTGTDYNFNEGGLVGALGEGWNKLTKQISEGITGVLEKDHKDPKILSKMREVMDSAFGDKLGNEAKDNGHAIGAGALVGAGASILTGAVVGPLFGAAIGAGIGLITNSTKVQSVLFGPMDDNGNFDDETTRGKIGNFFKNNFPTIAKGSVAGMVGGLFLGSPIIGAIVGGAAGFVKSSDKAKEVLFGKVIDGNYKEGLIPKKIQDKIKKGLPKLALGGVLGAAIGPFGGFIPNILLGSALGLYTETEDFKKKMFGDPDDEKSQKESFFGMIQDKITKNVDGLFHNTNSMIKGYGKLIYHDIIKDKVGGFFRNLMKNAEKGEGGLLTKIFGGALNIGNKIVKAPINMLGGALGYINEKTMIGNLKNGFNVYDKELGRNLTAAERIRRRDDLNIAGGQQAGFMDSLIANIENKEELDSLISGIGNGKNVLERREAIRKIAEKYGLGDKINFDKISRGDIENLSDLLKNEKENRNWEEQIRKEDKEYQGGVLRYLKILSTVVCDSILGKPTDEIRDNLYSITNEDGSTSYFDAMKQKEVTSPYQIYETEGGLANTALGRAFKYAKNTSVEDAFQDAKRGVKGIFNKAKDNIDIAKIKREARKEGGFTKEGLEEYFNQHPEYSHLKERAFSELSFAKGGVYKVPFAGDFSGLPYWGNKGLGDLAAGVWGGIKSIGSGIGSVFNGAKNLVGGVAGKINSIKNWFGGAKKSTPGQYLNNPVAGDIGGGAVNSMGGALGGGSGSIDEGETKKTVFDMFANPHQYHKTDDGEWVEDTNDRETDASRGLVGGVSEGLAGMGPMAANVAGIYALLSRLAPSIVSSNNTSNGTGGTGEGGGTGGTGLGPGLGGAAAGATFGQVVKSAIAPALGVGLITGALDGVGNTIGNANVFKGNDTNTAFDGASYLVDGHQVMTDAHGNPVIDANGNYQTIDGNYINATDGTMYDATGNNIGRVNANRISEVGNNNTWGNMTRKNLVQQGILGSAGHVAQNGAKGFGLNSVFGRLATKGGTGATWGERFATSKFATTAKSWATGIGNKITGAAQRFSSTKVGGVVTAAGAKVGGFASKIGNSIAKFFGKISDAIIKNPTVSKLLGNIKSKVKPFFDKLAEKFDDYFAKTLDNNGTLTSKFLKELDDVLIILKVGIIAKAIVDGWSNAPTYLGVVTRWNELPISSNLVATAINVINQLIPFIGGFIPTETLFNIFYAAASLVFSDSNWFNNWTAERQHAYEVVSAYNQENHTNLDIAGYNQVMENCNPLTLASQYYKEDVGELVNNFKNDGILSTMGDIAKGFGESVKENGLVGETARFIKDAATDNFLVRAGQSFDSNYGLGHAVDQGVANGNAVAIGYDKAMTGVGNFIVGAEDAAKDAYNTARSWMPWNWGKGSGIAGKGTGKSVGKSDNFISQLDPRYSNISIGNSSVADAGCAPAVAAMVASDYGKTYSFTNAINDANQYQHGNDGTTINYFGDAMSKNSIATGIIPTTGGILGNLKAGNDVVLLGEDANNNNKSVSPFGPNNHYVLASGLTKDGKIIIKDPESNTPMEYDSRILKNASLAIGTSLVNNTTRKYGIRGLLANAGNKLLNSAKNIISKITGRGTKGQAFHAEIWSWLHKNLGLNDVQTAAIMGCWEAESGNTPYVIEGYYLSGFKGYETVATNEGLDNYCLNVLFPAYKNGVARDAYKYNGHYYPGIGLAQWTGSRAAALYDYAKNNNCNWYDLESQLGYFKTEVSKSYSGVISKLKLQNNLEDAVEVFGTGFEHPSIHKGTKNYNIRLEAAKNIYSRFSNKPLADVSNLQSDTSTGSNVVNKVTNFLDGVTGGAFTNIKDYLSSIMSGNTPDGSRSTGLLGNIKNVFGAALSNALGAKMGIGSNTFSTTGTYGSSANLNMSNLTGPDRLVAIAERELGYQEKASNSQLDQPNANVGRSNYTKYGAYTGANGSAWCGSFVAWLFNQVANGDTDAMRVLLRADDSNNIPRSLALVDTYLNIARKSGALTNEPRKGDIVIYRNNASHAGIVSGVNPDGTFNTIEGNTSGTPKGFNADGGIVGAKTSIPSNYPKLTGFLRPNWDAVFAGKGSGIKRYNTKATRALHNWNRPSTAVKYNTAGSISNTYRGKSGTPRKISRYMGGMTNDQVSRLARNIAGKGSGNYDEALALIIKMLSAIAANTGSEGAISALLSEQLAQGSKSDGITEDQIKKILSASTAAAVKVVDSAPKNSPDSYNMNMGARKLDGDLARIIATI